MDDSQKLCLEKNDDDDEVKAKEKIIQRREARRRNILQNAKSRLERLNGRVSTANNGGDQRSNSYGTVAAERYEYSDPEVEPDINLIGRSNTYENANQFDESMLRTLINDSATRTSTQRRRNRFLKYRLHIIVCALFSLIITTLWPANSSYGFSIFTLSGLCIITDLVFLREQYRRPPIMEILMTLCGIKAAHASIILHIFSIVQSLLVDLGVFVFSFCIFSCISVLLNEQYTDLILIK
uniref:Hypothetical conserved protein n=1 Tax=Glossina morsitans morsitans TaxID=37546 RepID=D3TRG2_GLOMM